MKRIGFHPASAVLFVLAFGLAGSASVGAFRQNGNPAGDAPDCDASVPALASGYGTDGPYAMDMQSVGNPAFGRDPVLIFLPRGAKGRRPVIFFSHGFGPGRWESYGDLIRHMVSRGYMVVFSSYPALHATNEERYDALWAGFKAAVADAGDLMDLARVGFAGHSFGGGATPAMAYRGLVQQGWGKQGAFLLELAPWYSFEITTAQMQALPANAAQLTEVYDKDSTNDHRMAVDLYGSSHLASRYYMLVHSLAVKGCELTSEHDTPGRGVSLRLKQYAVFRPLDALADYVFTGSAASHAALASMGTATDTGTYQPLQLEAAPVPAQPESYYRWPWSSPANPRH